ncbi:MAG: hypothetical protein Q6363_008145 [Candidatus Njordarchaeota archaeon]
MSEHIYIKRARKWRDRAKLLDSIIDAIDKLLSDISKDFCHCGEIQEAMEARGEFWDYDCENCIIFNKYIRPLEKVREILGEVAGCCEEEARENEYKAWGETTDGLLPLSVFWDKNSKFSGK